MKRAPAAALALLCLAFTSETKWRYVAATPSTDFYVSDERTERDEHGRVRRWERNALRLDTPEGRESRARQGDYLRSNGVSAEDARRYTEASTFRGYDCPKGRVGYLHFYYLRDDGRIIFKEPQEKLERSWESPAPDSANEKLMLDACKREPELH